MTDVIIENARIIDGTGRAPFHGHIVIEQGAITMVGDLPADGLIKPGLKRINAKGKTVMPGLIDTHCHLSFDDAGSNSEIFSSGETRYRHWWRLTMPKSCCALV